MAKVPVLKPREVAVILKRLGFAEVGSVVLTSSSVILMEEAQPSLSTRVETSRPCCCVGSQKTPVSPLVSFSSINKDFPR